MSKPIELVIADLLRETGSWDSIDAHINITQTLFIAIGDNPPKTSVGEEHYIETFRGQKFYRTTENQSGTEVVGLLGYSDGVRCASVEFKRPPEQDQQHSITVTKTFMNEQLTGYVMRPDPLRWHFVGLIPLHEAIVKASQIGTDRVAGRGCDVFLFSAVPGQRGTQDLVYHLDRATSLPLKVEAFANQDRLKSAEPSWIWEAASLDEVQGFHVALSSRYTSFVLTEAASPTKQLTNEYKIDALKFNKSYDASTFWPLYDKGVSINDLIARKHYYNTPDKKAPPDVTAKTATAAGVPIVATEPPDYTPWIAGGGLMVGAILLLLGAGLWMRNR